MRQRSIFIFLSLLFVPSALPAQTGNALPQLIPYRDGNVWGYARRGGDMVIPPQFAEAGLFDHRLPAETRHRLLSTDTYTRVYPSFDVPIAMVRADSLYGLIDTSGRYIVEPSSTMPLSFFPVDTDIVWIGITQQNAQDRREYEYWSLALLHRSGRLITNFDYNGTIYDESECAYQLPEDPYGNRSILGEATCAPRSQYSDYIDVSENEKAGLLRKDGSVAYPLVWDEISLPRDGLVFAAYTDTTQPEAPQRRWVLADPDNRIVKHLPEVSLINTYARYFPIPAYLLGGGTGYLKADGTFAFAEKFKTGFVFSKNGYAIVQEVTGAWKIIDSTGRKVIDLSGYYGCRPWRDGYYIQLKDGLFYPFDRYFKQSGKTGLSAQNGQVILPPEFDPVVPAPDINHDSQEFRRDTLNTSYLIRVYPTCGIRFVTYNWLTSMQDLDGSVLIPFSDWHNYRVYPESQVVVVEQFRREGQTVFTVHHVYHLSGAFLFEVTGEHVWPLNRNFLVISENEKAELRYLPTGKILSPPGNYNFTPIDSMELVKITGTDFKVVGYCDYSGYAYFKD